MSVILSLVRSADNFLLLVAFHEVKQVADEKASSTLRTFADGRNNKAVQRMEALDAYSRWAIPMADKERISDDGW